MNWLLIKFLLIAAISIIPLDANALNENHDLIPINSEKEQVVGYLPEANITLYATQEGGNLIKFRLESNGNVLNFPDWKNVSNPAYNPKIYFNDINYDGSKELIIVLTNDYGTGVLEQNVHVLHKNKTNTGDTYKEILVDNPIAIIQKNVETTLNESEATITIGNEKTVIKIDKMGISPKQLFSEIFIGNLIEYNVLDDELTAIIGAQIAPVGGDIGSFFITYTFKDNMYQLKEMKFIPENNKKAP